MPARADQERLERLARLMDEAFRVPGTGWRIGLDGLIGLIPGIGDAATTLVAAYIVFEAYRLGAPTPLVARMVGNLLVDSLVGSIPVFGDIFDVAWKANRRNVQLLRRWLDSSGRL